MIYILSLIYPKHFIISFHMIMQHNYLQQPLMHHSIKRKPIKGNNARTIMQINNNRNRTCACNHRIQILTTPTILHKYWRVTTIHDPSFNTKQILNKSCLVHTLPYFRIRFRVVCILILWFYDLVLFLRLNHDIQWWFALVST